MAGCADLFARIDCPLFEGDRTVIYGMPMAAVGVRRDKAALFQWVKVPPG
jgi:hypothetical protein